MRFQSGGDTVDKVRMDRKAGIHMKTLISADNTWALFAILVVVAALAIWMEQKYKWDFYCTAFGSIDERAGSV